MKALLFLLAVIATSHHAVQSVRIEGGGNGDDTPSSKKQCEFGR